MAAFHFLKSDYFFHKILKMEKAAGFDGLVMTLMTSLTDI